LILDAEPCDEGDSSKSIENEVKNIGCYSFELEQCRVMYMYQTWVQRPDLYPLSVPLWHVSDDFTSFYLRLNVLRKNL
jgi:hypothetical protein